jgi:GNAT superfamily N-acetyltransferase
VRPAHPDDDAFVRHVCTVARLTSLRGPGVPVEEVGALAAMQVRAAERRRSLSFPMAASYVVLDDEECVGRLVIDAARDQLRVLDLVLLPQWQGRGIGTTVMLGLCQLADERRLPIVLDVPRDHGVVTFLRRMGFAQEDLSVTSVSLRRPVVDGSDAPGDVDAIA